MSRIYILDEPDGDDQSKRDQESYIRGLEPSSILRLGTWNEISKKKPTRLSLLTSYGNKKVQGHGSSW